MYQMCDVEGVGFESTVIYRSQLHGVLHAHFFGLSSANFSVWFPLTPFICLFSASYNVDVSTNSTL